MSVQNVLCGGFLLSGSIFDLYEKKIPLWLPVLCGTIAGGIRLMELAAAGSAAGTILMEKVILPPLPGVIMVAIGILPGRSMGAGDGLCTAAASLCTGFMFILRTVTLAFVLAAGYSMVLLVRRRVGRGTKIPFLPFLFAAYVLLLLRSAS